MGFKVLSGRLFEDFECHLEGFEGSLKAEGLSERFCMFGKIPIFALLFARIFKLTTKVFKLFFFKAFSRPFEGL